MTKRDSLRTAVAINQINVGETPLTLRGGDAASEEVPPLVARTRPASLMIEEGFQNVNQKVIKRTG